MLQNHGKLGLSLFAVYLLLYGGFVFLNAFFPDSMEYTPLAGVNLAIWYGFGLIFAAFGLALIYGRFGAMHESKPKSKGGQP
jgi:uncharacterized membrane protein (DUF485 family)